MHYINYVAKMSRIKSIARILLQQISVWPAFLGNVSLASIHPLSFLPSIHYQLLFFPELFWGGGIITIYREWKVSREESIVKVF